MTTQIVEETGQYNEIAQFQDVWYVSASESLWRVLPPDIFDNHPTVYPVDDHTEGNDIVCFREGEEQSAALREPKNRLTKWFRPTFKYPDANLLRYDEFPRSFT